MISWRGVCFRNHSGLSLYRILVRVLSLRKGRVLFARFLDAMRLTPHGLSHNGMHADTQTRQRERDWAIARGELAKKVI